MSKRSKSTNAGYIQGRSIGLESARADAAVAEAAALRAQLAAMSAAPIAPRRQHPRPRCARNFKR